MKNLLIIIVLAGIGYYVYQNFIASTPFLPMQKGQWQLTSNHSSNGNRTLDKCMDDAALKEFYGNDYLETMKNEEPSICTLTKEMGDEHIAIKLECTDKTINIHATLTQELTRKSKNNYLLTRGTVTTPSMPDKEFNETIEFTRLGNCK